MNTDVYSGKSLLITFDIDDTIRLHGNSQPSERPVWIWVALLFYREPVRSGFIQLCWDLKAMGCRIGIYTTSSRSIGYIRRWMRCYGLKPELIVNSQLHASVVSQRSTSGRGPSKHPGLFGGDLHIDDSEGVAMESETYGFRSLIVDPEDSGWCGRILSTVIALSADSNSSEKALK